MSMGHYFWWGPCAKWKKGKKRKHLTSPAGVKSTQQQAAGTENFKEKVVKNSTVAEMKKHNDRRGHWSFNSWIMGDLQTSTHSVKCWQQEPHCGSHSGLAASVNDSFDKSVVKKSKIFFKEV